MTITIARRIHRVTNRPVNETADEGDGEKKHGTGRDTDDDRITHYNQRHTLTPVTHSYWGPLGEWNGPPAQQL